MLPGLSAVKPRSTGSQGAGWFIKQAGGLGSSEYIPSSQRSPLVCLALRGASPAGRAALCPRFDELGSANRAQGSKDARICRSGFCKA